MTSTGSTARRSTRTPSRQKYAEERDKRLRPDGNDQYLQLDGPARPLPRRPLHAGRRARADDRPRHGRVHRRRLRRPRHRRPAEGGRASTTSASSRRAATSAAPGTGTATPARSATRPSFVYMPLLEETGHMPTEKYAHAPEILEHCQRIGKQFGLYDNALFHTEVTDLEWDDDRSRWIVRTNRGDEFTAQFVAMGTGPLHVPKLPGIPGIEALRGPLVPHQPVGLRLHRRRPARRADGRTWPTSGSPSSAPAPPSVQCVPAPRQGVRGALRLPAHAVVGRRARQPADRPRVVRRDRHAGLAAALARELHRQPDRRHGRRGPRDGRLDRPRPPHPRARSWRCRRRSSRPRR